MDKLTLITTTWNNEDIFPIEKTFLFKSFKKFNPNIDFIYFHYNKNNYKELEYNYKKYGIEGEYLLYKIYFLLEEIKCIDSKYLLFADANDMTCLKPLDGILELFDLNNFVIMGHEKNMMPSESEKTNWHNYKGYSELEKNRRIFLNSGFILARKDLFIKMLENIIKNIFPLNINTFKNDQGVYTYYYNNNIKPEIKLDTENKLVVNTYTRSTDEFYKNEKNQLIDKSNGNIPYFVHDNGWNYGSPKYNHFFELKRAYSI
jgi:hypothetical protein